MLDFTPKFPPTVGGDWRRPLHHPQLEVIGKRMVSLYRMPLKEDERGNLIVAYEHMIRCDLALVRMLGDAALPYSGERPLLPDPVGTLLTISNASDASEGARRGRCVGYIRRVEEYVDALERKYRTLRPAAVTPLRLDVDPVPADGWPRRIGEPIPADEPDDTDPI